MPPADQPPAPERPGPSRGDANGETSPAAATPGAGLPLFYRQPAMLTPARHGRSGLLPGSARFAAHTIAVPLVAEEFAAAARSFPVVMGRTPAHGAFAVVGLRQNQNLFVDAEGRWLADAYVPLYVRRYPFIFVEEPGSSRLTLCIDEAAEQFQADRAEGKGEALFGADGQPSDTTRRALAFCEAYQRGHLATQAMLQAFAEAGILTARNAEAKLPSGEKIVWTDFTVIERAKLDALADATLLDWRRKGWLEAAYAHLWSLSRWEALLALAAGRGA